MQQIKVNCKNQALKKIKNKGFVSYLWNEIQG